MMPRAFLPREGGWPEARQRCARRGDPRGPTEINPRSA